MRGETVSVNGSDVANVLVHVGDAKESDDAALPAGEVVAYTLYFPSDFEGTLQRGDVIRVRGRMCDVIGFADHERPRQVFGTWAGDWDMVVRVEACDGDMTAAVSVCELVATRDALGMPVKGTRTVWSGLAQARMTSGSESAGRSAETDATERWAFVLPWTSEVDALEPQSAIVEYGGAVYDATSIANVDEAGAYLSIEAVRHVG